MAGLIYEMVWGRLLVLIFGSTTQSMIAVISAYMMGLGGGSLIIGKVADRLTDKQLVKLYALLEAGVGISGMLTLVWLPLIRFAYARMSDGSEVTGKLLIVKFLLAEIILVLPTLLMGATLPVLAKWVKQQKILLARGVSRLYAVNTLGAATGVLLASLVMMELLGSTNTILAAGAINLSIAWRASLCCR
jgi:spermidine synthase